MSSQPFFVVAIFALATLGFVALPTTPPTVTISSGTLEGTQTTQPIEGSAPTMGQSFCEKRKPG